MKTAHPRSVSVRVSARGTPVHQQFIAVLLSLTLLFMNGCMVSSVRRVDVSQVSAPTKERIVGLTLKNGSEVSFDPPGATLSPTQIEGRVKSAPFQTPLADVQRLWLEHSDLSISRTSGLVGVLLVAGVLVVLAAKQSCPFVYSWDGTRYVFDAEPYGGAITRGLERDDFSELSELREHDGQYRLLVTNEVDETQHTNLMELWVVDHAKGARVVADEKGNLRAFRGLVPPATARDRHGRDIREWLVKTDQKIWEPPCVAEPDGTYRQEVVLTFPKPANATHVTLVANAATGMWGSYMLKKMTELRGQEAGAFLQAIDRDPAVVQAVHAWGEREETYRLRVEIEEPTGWQVRGSIPGGGPYLAEDRAVTLDVSKVPGDQLRIRLRPPVGFWALNSFALAADTGEAVVVKKATMQSARTWDGKDVRAAMATVDDEYYSMPELSDRAEVVFPAPPRQAGLDRSVFLHTRGWYQLHLKADGAPDRETVTQISTTPDGAARFAANYFVEWNRQPSLRMK